MKIPQFEPFNTLDEAQVFQNCIKICSKMKIFVNATHEFEIVDVVVHSENKKGEEDYVFDRRLTRKNGCWSVKVKNKDEQQYVQYIDINISSGGRDVAYRLNGLLNTASCEIQSGSGNIIEYIQHKYKIDISNLDEKKINEVKNFKALVQKSGSNKANYLSVPRYSSSFRLNRPNAIKRSFEPSRIIRFDLIKNLIREEHEHIVYLSLLSHNANNRTDEEIQALLGVTPRKTKKWVSNFLEGLETNLSYFDSVMEDGKITSKFDQCRFYGAWCKKYGKLIT